MTLPRRRLVSIGVDATVLDAAGMMNKHHIGALVVIENGELVGMFTERDVLRRVVAKRKKPDRVLVGQVMTKQVIVCNQNATVQEAASLMKHKRIRHVPIIDESDRVVGMISIGDINAHQRIETERTAQCLYEYLYT